MKLVLEEGKWRVQGKGRERARVAYATIMDNVLRYADDPTPQCGPSPGRISAE
jgi:hypothetical protein